jgi:sec-independent protein translocase protein TatA
MSSFPISIAGILGLGGPEVVIILAVMLLMFGGSKLPALAKGLGESVKEFKRATRDDPEPGAPTPAPKAEAPALALPDPAAKAPDVSK